MTPAGAPESAAGIEIRLYRETDEQEVVQLLREAFGSWPGNLPALDPVAFFRWKHLSCPWGRSVMAVADGGDGPIGFYAWLPYRLAAGERIILARRGTDLAVQPSWHGRGIAGRLLEAGRLHLEPGTAFSFGNPNERSRSGALRLDRRTAGRASRYVLPLHPIRAWRGRRADPPSEGTPLPDVDAEPAAEALVDHAAVASLLARLPRTSDRLVVAHDPEYLSWRYGGVVPYHAVRSESGGRLRGLVLFRLEPAGRAVATKVCEMLVEPGDASTARHLLRAAVGAAPVDYAMCSFPRGSLALRSALRCGFVPFGGGAILLVYPLVAGVRPDPTDRRSWALSHGDLEETCF